MSCLRQGISPLCGNIKYITLLILRYQIDYIIILATVITNLLSAIPFIGGDLVPLSIILSLYLLYTIYITLFIYNINYTFKRYNSLSRLFENSKSDDIRGDTLPSERHDIKNIDKNLLALIVGFIDGDGYIRITKKTKYKPGTNQETLPLVGYINYIYISLIINLNENELELLQYFHKHLNIGKVYNITPKKGKRLARWEINKTDLFNILEPLLEYHQIKFLTETRQKQFLLLKYIKLNKLIYYKDIIKHNDYINKYIEINKISNNFNQLDYFNNWLIGFTMAEGSFLIKKNKDICFQFPSFKVGDIRQGRTLKQKYNLELFINISNYFNTSRKLNISNNKFIQFNVSSKNDIQNIINFYSFSNNHPLLGNKLISYNKWLLAIKNSVRYKELNIPYINSSPPSGRGAWR